jgi:hypothetical protein
MRLQCIRFIKNWNIGKERELVPSKGLNTAKTEEIIPVSGR